MTYRLPPAPIMDDPNVKVVQDVCTPGHLKALREYGDALIAKHPLPAKVGFNAESAVDESKRRAVVQWLPFPDHDKRTQWIYAMAADVLQQANGLYWRYHLTDFYDQLHYIRYTAPVDHFSWHQDRGDDWRRPQRKLAFTLLLSDPSEYEGGGFQIFDGREITIKAQDAGTFIIFPSFIQHRVLPVTRGERRSLVGWAAGPAFR